MTVELIIEDQRWQAVALATLAEQAEAATLLHLGLDPQAWEISLLACSDDRIAMLNADFRNKSQPTNVLSWPSQERAASKDGETPQAPLLSADPELGDIALAFETCQQEAQAAGKPLADHTTHLLVHGILHLLGYDHVRDKDATLMEALEVKILGKLGLDNPY